MVAVLLASCMAGDVEIVEARILTGGAFRPGLWAPLRVRTRTSRPFRGRFEVRTDLGCAFVKEAEIGPGPQEVILPVLALALDAPLRVRLFRNGAEVAGLVRKSLGRGLYQSERLIAGAGKVPDNRTVVFPLPGGGVRLEWLEAVDAVVGAAPPGYEAMGGIVAPDLDSALKKIAARGPFRSRWFEPVDPLAQSLVPRLEWIERKRDFVLWFTALYASAAVGALFLLWSWRPRMAWIAVLAGGGIGSVAAATLLPAGEIRVERFSCDRNGTTLSLYAAQRARGGPTDLVFPDLAKPVFADYREAVLTTFELHMEEGRTRIERMSLPSGEVRLFSTVSPDGAKAGLRVEFEDGRVVVRGTARGVGVVAGTRVAFLGDVKGRSAARLQKGAEPDDPVYRYFRRRAVPENRFAYGWVDGGRRMVAGRDVAEEHVRPMLSVRVVAPN